MQAVILSRNQLAVNLSVIQPCLANPETAQRQACAVPSEAVLRIYRSIPARTEVVASGLGHRLAVEAVPA